MKALSTNKRAMHVIVKAFGVELDYKDEVTRRWELGEGTVDLGVYLLNKANQPETESDGRADSGKPGAQYQIKVEVESKKREPVARVALDLRADARAWNAAYAWRLRTIYYPAH